MIFNSIEFLLFVSIVFIAYWSLFAKKLDLRNVFLLICSYTFYSFWDWRFLGLIFLSSLIDFILAKKVSNIENTKRKYYMLLSVFVNLLILGFFKYFNFFIDSFSGLLNLFGFKYSLTNLEIVLPVGISFYTFQSLSYTIDVYRGEIKVETNLITFLTYVSFFPQLVAGPIERATVLLPQFNRLVDFDESKAFSGMKRIVWGLVKKILIADNCSLFVNQIFGVSDDLNGITLFIGGILFTIQIYCDFSGYSDIAIGLSKLFGFNLRENFKYPLFSRNLIDFWRRWHISLSSWFRDYIYIPLGGNRDGFAKQILYVLTVFILCGSWHGANWTFVLWGFLNGVLMIPDYLLNKKNAKSNIMVYWLKRIRTFVLVSLLFIVFRSESLDQMLSIFNEIFSPSIFEFPSIDGKKDFLVLLLLIGGFLIIEFLSKEYSNGMGVIERVKPKIFRYGLYYLIVFLTLRYGFFGEVEFIYFQF